MEKYVWSLIATVFQKWNIIQGYDLPLKAVTYIVNVVAGLSKKWCRIDTPLIESIIWSIDLCHLQWPWMTLNVIRQLQDLSNAIQQTFVRHSARFQVTRRVGRSLDDSWASCCYSCTLTNVFFKYSKVYYIILSDLELSPVYARNCSVHLAGVFLQCTQFKCFTHLHKSV